MLLRMCVNTSHIYTDGWNEGRLANSGFSRDTQKLLDLPEEAIVMPLGSTGEVSTKQGCLQVCLYGSTVHNTMVRNQTWCSFTGD